mmetsp:Transcript_29250/g.32893  ORF Transcript_29250/g.32893 Transcript_29250/m.32893 type:complete len:101 (-) Transcript_29250:58-360(-)
MLLFHHNYHHLVGVCGPSFSIIGGRIRRRSMLAVVVAGMHNKQTDASPVAYVARAQSFFLLGRAVPAALFLFLFVSSLLARDDHNKNSASKQMKTTQTSE